MKSLLTLVLVAVTLGVCPLGAADSGRISSPHLRIRVDDGTGALVEMVDRGTGRNLLGPVVGARSLWQIDLMEPAGVLTATNAKSFHIESLKGPQEGLVLKWRDFGPGHPQVEVRAQVHVDPAQPVSYWKIQVDGLSRGRLAKVRFPQVPPLARQARESLAVPLWMGQEMADPREGLAGKQGKGQRHEWPYPGLLSLQCLALSAEQGSGFYFAADDVSSVRKTFAVTASADGDLTCDMSHLPEVGAPAESSWRMPYQAVLGTFQGDWVTAAERYRSWATNQVWARQSRLARSQTPDWIASTGLWIWNRGRSPDVLTPALEMQRRLNLPVSVFWHWWHGCSYDAGFPEYFPPREGKDSFIAAVSDARARKVRAMVYMNQRLWGMTTASWTNENAERWAVKGSDGKIHPEVYNTFTKQACVSMCMGTAFWREKYAGLAEQAVRGLGVAGIYMDQACTSLACYDPAHPHSRGGGAYWVQGFRTMSEDIRQRVNGAAGSRAGPLGLAGEGCGESWLPYLDLMLSLQVSKERYAAPDGWETIPFFHAVYHPYVVLFGNYSSLTMPPYDDLWPGEFAPKEPLQLLDAKFTRQFLMEQARAFVWGQQPTVANFQPAHFESRRVEMDYVVALAHLRHRTTEYLLDGTYVRPPVMKVPEAEFDMSRLSIYAGQQGGLTTFRQTFPLVYCGAWRSPRGSLALALANIADEAVPLSFHLDPAYYKLPRHTRLRLITASQPPADLGALSRDRHISFDIPARTPCLLEFVPDKAEGP